MGSDDLFKKRKGERKKRKEMIRERIPYRYLIVCEGGKTEPNYFDGIRKSIDQRYKSIIDVRAKPEIDIEGTGRNTESLVDYALALQSRSTIPYGHIWVVFDKDSFTDEQFNNAIEKAEDNGLKVAWSNEAIELWFLLHFEFFDSQLHRHQYQQKLDHYFKRHNINKGKYQKNLKDIFDILSTYGNLPRAIKFSEKLHEIHKRNGISTAAKMNPCTTVHKLVSELIKFIS